MRRLNVAVIGVGFWGRNHVRVLREIDRANLVAVCDIDGERARAVADRYGLEAYTDSGELLRREDVEAVTICTWPAALGPEAEKALRAGKHVLVEKPMARDAREARGLVELAEREDLILAVGFVERFNPGLRRVLRMTEEGRLGEVLSVQARRLSRRPRRPKDVGVVKDLAIHDVDIMVALYGEGPELVHARVRYSEDMVDEYALATMFFPGGGIGVVEASWLTAPKVRELVVSGTEGVLKLGYLSQEIEFSSGGEVLKIRDRWEEPLKIELEHFVDCVLSGREPLVSGRDGLRALSICEAILRSSVEGRPIRVGREGA